MASELYKVSTPGSLMLLGEHAVLHGKQAMVSAIDKRLHIELQPNSSKFILITDTRLGTLRVNIDDLTVQAPFTHVLQAILLFKSELQYGFNLNINSEFPSTLGLGSSAAVTVATIAVLCAWLKPCSNDQIFALAQQCNAGGSGADLAASIYGGTLQYSIQDQVMQRLVGLPPLTAVYSGYKTPTKEVLKIIDARRFKSPDIYAKIFAAMQECVTQGLTALSQHDWPALGQVFLQQHYLQGALGTSNCLLDSIVHTLIEKAEIYGAKISGAGLGDCVIGLGKLNDPVANIHGQTPMTIMACDRGLVYEHN